MTPNPVVAYVAVDAAKLVELFSERFVEMRRQGFEVVAFVAPGPGVSALESLGVEVVPIPVDVVLDPGRQAAAWVLLSSAFVERRVLLVDCHSLSLHLLVASAAKVASVPVVCATVHTHGLDALADRGGWAARLGRPGVAAWFRAVAALVDAYIVQHEEDARFAREVVGVPEGKLHVIEALVGVDVRALSPGRSGVPDMGEARARLGSSGAVQAGGDVLNSFSGAARWIGTFGRRGLPEASGLLALVDAVQREDPSIGWVVGSSVELPEALGDGLRARRREGRPVISLPSRLAVERPTLYSAVDVVALPWTGYGAGLLAMEAAAMRRPVVVYDRVDTRDVVIEGQTGHRCAVGDRRAFVEALLRLVRSESRRRDLGAAGRARAEARFDAEHGQLHLFSVYDRLIEARVGGAAKPE